MRAAIYARYSSENQREASIEDQVRLCKVRLTREGWSVAATYSDRAINGSQVLRPGYQKLLRDVREGHIDVVVAEALDRVSRDQEHVAGFFKQLSFAGVKLITIAEGEISELHVGLKGTMNALFLKDLAAKTHRGLEGRVRAGKSAGGKVYGYDIVREIDSRGEPVRGNRVVNESEAAIVRRIFAEFAAGRSPRKIAYGLNAQGIPGPSGNPWQEAALRGHSRRRNGILRNDLYVGRLVWNRQRFVKDPLTGRRLPRINPQSAWIIEEVPHLRIIDNALANAVRARLDAIEQSPQVQKVLATRFWDKRRPSHLLTGLVRCGACGGVMAAVGGDYLACSAARKSGTCTNRRGMPRGVLENVILDTLKHHLMAPELVKEFITSFQQEVTQQLRTQESQLDHKRRELAEIRRRLDGLIDAIAGGLRSAGLQEKLEALEAQKAALATEIEAAPQPAPRLHPNLPELYCRRVAQLGQALSDPASCDEALQILRGLIDQVEVTPVGKAVKVEFVGQIANMLILPTPAEAGRMAKHQIAAKRVAGARNRVT